MADSHTGRTAQRTRTRKAILQAAARLLERGEHPGLDDVAVEAEVSRATAYRYFPGLDALLNEAVVDAAIPEPEVLFDDELANDVAARVALIDETLDRACREREVALRMTLARSLERSAVQKAADGPLRQNRRVPLIERALSPLAKELDAKKRTRLTNALAMIVGSEGFIALTDVVGLTEEEAREVRRWAIDALLEATAANAPSHPIRTKSSD
jgi:AcrR family transcriptional regulator